MAAIRQQDLEKESRFMTFFWRYIKDTYEPEDSSEYWEMVISRGDEIYKQCGSDLNRKLLMTYIDWLEQKNKTQEGKE